MKIFVNTEIKNIISSFCKGRRKDFTDQYLYVIHNLRIRRIQNRDACKETFLPINSEILRKIVSYDEATDILKNLVKLGIFDKEANYSAVKEKSNSFRLSQKYVDAKWTSFELTDDKLIFKIQEYRNSNISRLNYGQKVVYNCLKMLEIDYANSKRVIDYSFEKGSHAHDCYMNSINGIKEKDFFVLADDHNRLHNNMTNLATKTRKYLRINGEELWGVDISNSQPLFLGLIMMNSKVDKTELAEYLKVCLEGRFYEVVAKKGKFKLTKANRSAFKKKIFGGALFDINRKKLSKWETIFQQSFPTIFAEVRKIKYENNHNELAILLQKEEGKFIFDTVEEIHRKDTSTILLTVHDNIMSTEEYIETVLSTMKKRFKEIYNVEPKLKIEKK